MDLEEVKQVYYITREIEMYKKELQRIKEKSYVKGQDLSGMPMAAGNGDKTSDRAMAELEYENLIKEAQYRLVIEKNKILRFISTIDDSIMRQIIFYRHVSLLPWRIVAREVGGDNTPDSVRKAHQRFFSKK